MSADAWSVCPRCALDPAFDGYRRFREDFEIYGAETGTVTVSYSGECQTCGLALKFETEHPIPGWKPTPANQPDKARKEPRPWGQIPAGWFVQIPGKDEWWEVRATSNAGHLQTVTMRAPGGQEGTWDRPVAAKVIACPGTAPSPSGQALAAFQGGFPAVQIIEDQVS